MISYLLKVKMADQALEITDRMIEEMTNCAYAANDTIVSQREKRTYEVLGRKGNDPYAILIRLTSKNAVNPTRSLSTLSRKVIKNKYLSKILDGHTPNGSVFKSEIIDTNDKDDITFKTDPDIVAEIISIFFSTDMLPKEKKLASETAEKLREIVLEYINSRKKL